MLDERRNLDLGSDFSHLIENMKTDRELEGKERVELKGTDQARDLVNAEIIDFNTKFPEINIANREQMLAIGTYIKELDERDPEAASELVKLVNAETAKQLPSIQNQEQIDFVNEMASKLEGMTGEDLDAGIEKARSAHS